MNKTKKGDRLEEKIFKIFEDDISQGRFLIPKDQCKIYKKKGYYSKDREKNIIFDISIEIYMPGYDTYSILYIIECKNYNHRVPVDDVEEFFAKVQQISGANNKAVIVSNNAFQSGAFKFSQSKGIGLVRYYDCSNLEWVLTRSPSSLVSRNFATQEWRNARDGLRFELFKSNYYDFYGYTNGDYTNSLNLFMSKLAIQGQSEEFRNFFFSIELFDEKQNWQVQYVKESEIESLCKSVRNDIGYQSGIVSLNDICKLLKDKYNLKVIESAELDNEILGKINFERLEIHINKHHENEGRKRFTLSHEIGHFLLGHSEYMNEEKCIESAINLYNPPKTGIKDIMRMEWQANQFASSLLLPKDEFSQTFKSIIIRNGIKDRGFGALYIDNQKCNQENYYKVTSLLMRTYSTSREAVQIRLRKFGYINESR